MIKFENIYSIAFLCIEAQDLGSRTAFAVYTVSWMWAKRISNILFSYHCSFIIVHGTVFMRHRCNTAIHTISQTDVTTCDCKQICKAYKYFYNTFNTINSFNTFKRVLPISASVTRFYYTWSHMYVVKHYIASHQLIIGRRLVCTKSPFC
jgi:hypothetical protein